VTAFSVGPPPERLEVVTERKQFGVYQYSVTCPDHGEWVFPPDCFASAVLFAHDHFRHRPIPAAPRPKSRPKSRRRRIVVTL
jgi:hypothetical protein